MTASSVHPSLLPYLEQRLPRLLLPRVQASCTTWILLSLTPVSLRDTGITDIHHCAQLLYGVLGF